MALTLSASAGAQDWDRLALDLGEDDAGKREEARQKLQEGGAPAAQALLRLVEGQAGLAKQIAELVAQLEHASWRAREQATRALEKLGLEAVEALEKVEKSANPEVVWRAKLILENVKKQGVAEGLRRVRRREAAVRLLAEMGEPAALPALVRELDSQHRFLPVAAAYGLGRIRRPEAVGALARKINDKDWLLANHALWALGAIGDASALDALVAYSKEAAANPYLRSRSLDAIERIALAAPAAGRSRVCKHLAALLSDPAWEVRAQAHQALRAVAGVSFEFRYHAPQPERDAQARVWQAWASRLPDQ